MFRAWGIGKRIVGGACVSLMLLVMSQAAAASVGQVWHDLGLGHAADPLAGALVQHHAPDHIHSAQVKDPHSDWDGPPIVTDDDGVDPNLQHHHHYDNQAAVWILPAADPAPAPTFVATHWAGYSIRLAGVPAEGADPPPRSAFLQTA